MIVDLVEVGVDEEEVEEEVKESEESDDDNEVSSEAICWVGLC